MKVYPRVYGGTRCFREGLCVRTWAEVYPRVYGGTPFIRGTGGFDEQGSIPACTGEPYVDIQRRRHFSERGLSPRVRGNPPVRFGAKPPMDCQVYPRVYGGTQSPKVRTVGTGRSIPACTGEPYLVNDAQKPMAVYPRVYGGTHIGNGLTISAGSIPACTGEPGRKRSATGYHHVKVYPRVYGGTSTEFIRLFAAMSLFSRRVEGRRSDCQRAICPECGGFAATK